MLFKNHYDNYKSYLQGIAAACIHISLFYLIWWSALSSGHASWGSWKLLKQFFRIAIVSTHVAHRRNCYAKENLILSRNPKLKGHVIIQIMSCQLFLLLMHLVKRYQLSICLASILTVFPKPCSYLSIHVQYCLTVSGQEKKNFIG